MKSQGSLVVALCAWAVLPCGFAQDPPDRCSSKHGSQAKPGDPDAFFRPPQKYAGDLGDHRSPLKFYDGGEAKTVEDWQHRSQEILERRHGIMGPCQPLIEKPKIEFVRTKRREDFTQRFPSYHALPPAQRLATT